MTYVLVLMDDHRDWLSVHMDAIRAALPEPPTHTLHVVDADHRGYTRQMVDTWRTLTRCECEHALFWEADFRPLTTTPLDDMRRLLAAHPDLAQVALLRQPWFANEITHGGVIEALEAQGVDFADQDDPVPHIRHRAGWTGNPSLFPRALVDEHPWPFTPWSESAYGQSLVAAGYSFAYLGTDRAPMVEHCGVRTEASGGY